MRWQYSLNKIKKNTKVTSIQINAIVNTMAYILVVTVWLFEVKPHFTIALRRKMYPSNLHNTVKNKVGDNSVC